MPISNLKYAGRYNAYDLVPNEVLWQERAFECGQYEKIITQMQVIRTTGATTGRLLTKWVDVNNKEIATETIQIPVTTRWGRFYKVYNVPQNAVGCIQAIDGQSTGFTFACAMTDVGETLRAFNFDLAGMTSYLGPDGLYTGSIFTNQILIKDADGNVVGTLDATLFSMESGVNTAISTANGANSAAEHAGITAGDALTESQKAVQKGVTYAGVKISPQDGFVNVAVIDNKTLEVKLNATEGIIFRFDGKIIGGVEVEDGMAQTLASRIINPENRQIWWEVGETGEGLRGALNGYTRQSNGSIQNFLKIAQVLNIATIIYVEPRSSTDPTKGMAAFMLRNGNAELNLSEFQGVSSLSVPNSRVVVSETEAFLRFGTNSSTMKIIGVDSLGAYKRIGSSGPKTYL